MVAIREILEQYPITSLTVSATRIRATNICEEIARVLQNPQCSLTTLNLIYCYPNQRNDYIPEEDCKVIAESLPGSKIENLSFKGASLEYLHLKHIIQKLPECPNLTSLKLGSSRLGHEPMKALKSILPNCNLKRLELSGCYIGMTGAEYLSCALPGSKIEYLDLGFNHIKQYGFRCITRILHRTAIKEINISFDTIDLMNEYKNAQEEIVKIKK